jgi:FG-GAP-like repeat
MSFNARRFLGACSAALLLASALFAQTFAAPKHYPPFTDISQMVAADFNRDGAVDLVGYALINNGTQTQIMVYMNSGTGTFSAPVPIPGSTGGGYVAVGDFNQDGNMDIAFLYGTTQVAVSYGDGRGKFASPLFYTVNGTSDSIVVGDFNNDGKQDIATLSDSTKMVTILTNTGTSFTSSSFAVPLYYSSNNKGYPPDTVSDLVAGDFNGTHVTDLAYLDTCADSACGPGLARVYTLINSNSGAYAPNLLPEQISGFVELHSADLDLDGKVDLLVSSWSTGFDSVYVDYSNGSGSFTQVYINNDLTSYGPPHQILVGDFNNDGIEDIAGYTDQDLYGGADYGFDVYTGKGGRTGFNTPAHFADNVTASPRGGFAAGFIDQNGTKDIAMIDPTGLAIFLNTTATTKDPCAYPTNTGIHNCGPLNGSSGPARVHVLDAYKASAQPALRIEFWADGHKLFQEYSDLLNTYVTLTAGTHQLSVVGVDATGKYVKSNTTYTVK